MFNLQHLRLDHLMSMMKVILVLSLVATLITQGYSDSCKGRCGKPFSSLNDCNCDSKCQQHENCCGDYKKYCGRRAISVTDAEIKSLSEKLYSLDSNRATASELVIDPQEEIPDSQTGLQNDLSSRPLFKYVNEAALFSKPTYKALLTLLDNYKRVTGEAEDVPSQESQEQDTFLRETMVNTAVGKELYNFFNSKGAYSSQNEFIQDLKNMWFGLYSRNNGKLDSSGFEHIFAGEIKGGKVSGFHNWLQFYRNEKQGLLDYYSHSFDGAWTTYPDVLGMQFEWDGYYKQVGSAFIGSSPEFDLAMYTLCYVARPGKMCYLSLGGKTQPIQTYTWDKSSYGDGKKYIASAYPATP